MARCINAEQFEKRLMELFMEPRYMHDEDNYYTAMSIAIDEIRHTPTADVVPKSEVEKLNKEFDELAEEHSDLIVEKDKLFDIAQKQKAEIEALKLINSTYECDTYHIKAVAIQEFAYRLKPKLDCEYGNKFYRDKCFEEIDKLVREMTEDNK